MAPEFYKVSVPGSLMLMGEHAVLQGKQAIVCAVNKRLHMQLIPTTSVVLTINDTRLGTQTQPLQTLQIQAPFKFVLSAILLFKDQIPGGFTLEIDSEFSSVIGFGSSAAVTVATIAIFAKWLDIPLSEAEIFYLAKQVILDLQGVGSGADVAASVYGGVIGYSCDLDPGSASAARDDVSGCHPVDGTRTCHPGRVLREPGSITKLPLIPNLTAIYCGYKTPTPEVIRIVTAAAQNNPEKFTQIYNAMQVCVEEGIEAIQQKNWSLLGELFTRHHALQADLGTSNNLLDALVQLLTAQPQIYGAKISGAGLGDCVIGLGDVAEQLIPANDGKIQFQVNIEQQGLTYAIN